MAIEIVAATLGMVHTNSYLIGDTETKRAVLIDPVDEAETLAALADKQGWTIALILATHAHFDHVLASADLKAITQAPFQLHEEAAPYLQRLPQTGLRFTGRPFPEAAVPDTLLEDNAVIQLDSIELHALYTPGHAPGHLSYYMPAQQTVFSGDALFAGSIGRTDLEGGSLPLLMQSIQTRLLALPDETRVLAGHMEETTIGTERHSNPYLLQFGAGG